MSLDQPVRENTMTDKIDTSARRHWKTSGDDSWITCYTSMKNRVTLRELVDHFAEHFPGVDPWTVRLNYVTATWDEPPTEAELQEREDWRVQQVERKTAWERRIYAELKAKFESAEVSQ